MLDRRDFIKIAATAGGMGLVKPVTVLAKRRKTSGYFGVHPFIENHPEAVFIIHTDVDVKTNSEAKKKVGIAFSHSVFLPMKEGGVPLTSMIPIKPNLTCSSPDNKKYSLEYGMGIVTDPYFVEGVIEGMKELGLSGNQFFLREVNCPGHFKPRGYTAMAERTRAEIRDMARPVGMISENDLQWVDIPDGVAHRKLPYLWPINTRDTFLLNIAKFKAHGMGLTLCCKNHQGSIARDYQDFCHGMQGVTKLPVEHINPNAEGDNKENYRRHVADGIPRWDRPDPNGGWRMEVWAARTLDNLSVTPFGLNIIEGIYGRDGNGFQEGPNGPNGDEAWDYMTNIIIFGKNPVLVDIIGHWLGGHEPGNFCLFHMAMERGLSHVLNPKNIPVYRWKDGAVKLTPLEHFERTPLKTYYLPRDYNGQNEPYFHLCDEYFDYTKIKEEKSPEPEAPYSKILYESMPAVSNPIISIEYALTQPDYSRVDVLDTEGRQVESLTNAYHKKGAHLAVWNTRSYKKDTYTITFRTGDFTEIHRLFLQK